jgi:hypothetical protein
MAKIHVERARNELPRVFWARISQGKKMGLLLCTYRVGCASCVCICICICSGRARHGHYGGNEIPGDYDSDFAPTVIWVSYPQSSRLPEYNIHHIVLANLEIRPLIQTSCFSWMLMECSWSLDVNSVKNTWYVNKEQSCFNQQLPQESTPILMLPLVLQNLSPSTPFTASDCLQWRSLKIFTPHQRFLQEISRIYTQIEVLTTDNFWLLLCRKIDRPSASKRHSLHWLCLPASVL